MFQTESFIANCRAALSAPDTQAVIQALVAKAVSDPAQLISALGAPTRAGVNTLYKADDLTILNLCWGPRMVFHPHNHRMWAVIGIYSGSELNTFYQRHPDNGLTQHGSKALNGGDVTVLGKDVIHSVTNPLDQITAALHVYGGNFFGTARSEWDPQTFTEHPYDVEHTMRAFEASNARV